MEAESGGLQHLLLAALLAPQRLGVPPSDALASRKLAAAARVRSPVSRHIKATCMISLSLEPTVHVYLCLALTTLHVSKYEIYT